MNGHKWAVALAALLCAGAFGAAPQGRELESLRLVTALAVDGGEQTRLTAVTGVRASEGEEAEVLEGAGDSLTAAYGDLRERSARRAYLGQVEQILVGQGQALDRVLEFVVEHRELRLDALLYIVRGEAGAALGASAEKVGTETGGRHSFGVTVGEILPRLTQGDRALVPALRPDEEGRLSPAGWAVLDRGGIIGYLEGDAAVGAMLLNGETGDRAVTLPGGGVEVTSARCWAGDGTLCCTLTARTTEGGPTEEELAAWGERCLRAALGFGWDCWGLDRELAAFQPWAWEKYRGTDVRTLAVKVKGRLVGNGGRDA